MTDIRDEVAAALAEAEAIPYIDGVCQVDYLLATLAARGLTVVREDDCHCAERNVTHGRGCPCGNLVVTFYETFEHTRVARQPEGQ